MVRGSTLVWCLVMLVSACSSDDDGGASPQGVASWICCTAGESCTCHEETPNSGVLCSNYVDACGQMDGGAGCCVAAIMGNRWDCVCSVAGAACPTPGAGCMGDCPTPSNVQSVPSCPP